MCLDNSGLHFNFLLLKEAFGVVIKRLSWFFWDDRGGL